MFAALLAGVSADCAESAPQMPEVGGASATSNDGVSPDAGASDSQAAPTQPAADGGSAGQSAMHDSGVHLPPTGGAPESGPGMLLTDVSTFGHGACAGFAASDVIGVMKSEHPELADIPSSREPGVAGDGSFVFSYLRDDGSFALIVKRGSDDCVAGCISKEYWYFETDAMCFPQQVGHYDGAFDNAGNCYAIIGEPLWDVPVPIDPMYVCGVDNHPQSISGTHHFRAQGMRLPCALSDHPLDPIQLDEMIAIDILQDAADPSHGKVMVTGTGESWIDGRALDAAFSRRRFDAGVNEAESVTCSSHQLQLSYDFESSQPGQLDMLDTVETVCSGAASATDTYCKGHLTLALSALD